MHDHGTELLAVEPCREVPCLGVLVGLKGMGMGDFLAVDCDQLRFTLCFLLLLRIGLCLFLRLFLLLLLCGDTFFHIGTSLLLLVQRDIIDDGHTCTCPYQLGQIGVKGLVREHGQILALCLRIRLGQCDTQNLRSLLGILVDRLIEIALAEQQHRVRVFLFQGFELFHQRRSFLLLAFLSVFSHCPGLFPGSSLFLRNCFLRGLLLLHLFLFFLSSHNGYF